MCGGCAEEIVREGWFGMVVGKKMFVCIWNAVLFACVLVFVKLYMINTIISNYYFFIFSNYYFLYVARHIIYNIYCRYIFLVRLQEEEYIILVTEKGEGGC